MFLIENLLLAFLLIVVPWGYLGLLCYYLWAQVRDERVAVMMVIQTGVTFLLIAGLNLFLALAVATEMYDIDLPEFFHAIYDGDFIDLAAIYAHPLILWTLAVSLTAFNIFECTQRLHLTESSGDAVIILIWTLALPMVGGGIFWLVGGSGIPI